MKKAYILLGAIGLLVVVIIAINWKSLFKPQAPGTTGAPGGGAAPTPTGTGGTSSSGGSSTSGGSSSGGSTIGGSGTGTSTGTSTASSGIPKELVAAIYNDCTCTFCTRDNSLYTQLYYLDDRTFGLAYYYWQQVYQLKTNLSLPQMIADQGSLFNTEFSNQQSNLAARFAQLGLV